MNHKITFTTQQIIAIREAIHSIAIKGSDAWLIGGVLDKLYHEIGKAVKEEERNKAGEPVPNESLNTVDESNQ